MPLSNLSQPAVEVSRSNYDPWQSQRNRSDTKYIIFKLVHHVWPGQERHSLLEILARGFEGQTGVNLNMEAAEGGLWNVPVKQILIVTVIYSDLSSKADAKTHVFHVIKRSRCGRQLRVGNPVFNLRCVNDVTERGNPCQLEAVCDRRPAHDFDRECGEVSLHSATR